MDARRERQIRFGRVPGDSYIAGGRHYSGGGENVAIEIVPWRGRRVERRQKCRFEGRKDEFPH